ncbi:hypothetical protein [Actinomyces sp. oral taxon 181]|uniref:hypothetical protein n=1 Tax=Actinomyces sp. oral taxon 181 TaxID=712121 RepID=UPI0025B9329F|nr:hypothetical protein [Actinomyces sp. oral taxon 181]MBS5751176.1 hypothetical protein [Actinomyces sp. oral taxon 181]
MLSGAARQEKRDDAMRACAARSLTAYFDAGQVLFGHCIMVRGTLKKGAVSAYMGG